MPANTSKNDGCRCDSNCGCCLKKKQKSAAPGIIGKRPWLLVIVAFMILFAAWGTMFAIALTHQPEPINIERQPIP